MSDRIKDRYAGFVLFFLSVFSWFVIIPYGIESDMGLTKYGPDLFPKFITISVMILSAFIVFRTFLKENENDSKEGEEGAEEDPESPGRPWVGMAVFVVMIGYVFLAEWLGFLYSTIISMSLIMWLLAVRKWYFYVILVAIIVLLEYVFTSVFHIRLP